MAVLRESLEVTVPRNTYVQVESKIQPGTRDEGARRVYLWKHSHLEASVASAQNQLNNGDDTGKVQLTSFRSWEDLGSWWAALANPQAAVTPEIQAKADEITAGLKSDSERLHAIYRYVSMKFRYVSISLGIGRYRPHTAAEVLANQYGDCKDKHTLFVALLRAKGIEAWPALIGAGIKFDAAVPSPVAFDHVITVIPDHGTLTWLDTTAEEAPFGLISMAIRDQEALVIPSSAGKPFLEKTPIDPPEKASNSVQVTSSLDAEGNLKAHLSLEVAGDGALDLRSAFRQLAPAQWQALAQQLSYGLGFAGEVTGVAIENLEDVEKPFRLGYDYSRKNYSAWAEDKITLPLPPIGFGPGDESEKPKEPFWSGAPGVWTLRSSVRLPSG